MNVSRLLNTRLFSGRYVWLLLCFNALLLFIKGSFWSIGDESKPSKTSRSLKTQKYTSQNRPLMYTFYMKQREHSSNDLDTLEHLEMLRTWKQYWEAAGWETQVLTGDDAMRHPQFETYSTILNQLKISTYDHYCFYRWMAMVTVGGGWMSDYDVVPLLSNWDEFFASYIPNSATQNIDQDNRWLPNNGELTSFCAAVPCLMSGTADEWDRVIDHIITQYVPRNRNRHFSDMKGLIKFALDKQPIHMEPRVYPWVEMKLNHNRIDCEKYHGQIAWHFSHIAEKTALDQSLLPSRRLHAPQYFSRAWHIHNFMHDWKQNCLPILEKNIMTIEQSTT